MPSWSIWFSVSRSENSASWAAGGQFAVDDQVGGLDEGAFFRQFRDVVAAVAQDALFAVDEGDGAFAGAGVAVAGVEGDAAGLRGYARAIITDPRPGCRIPSIEECLQISETSLS
jgi:hypothetical protein